MTLPLRLVLALLLALMLTVLPLPELLAGFRPPWLLLLILYVQFFLPSYFNVTVVVALGLCLDVLLSTALGEHAFALIITTWIAAGKSRRFCFFSMIQQMLLLSVFCLIYESALYLIDAFLGYSNTPWTIIEASFMGMLFWPWLRLSTYHESH